MSQLNDSLPKANYSPIKTVQLDRKNFFKTIGGSVDLQTDHKEAHQKKLPNLSLPKNKVPFFILVVNGLDSFK